MTAWQKYHHALRLATSQNFISARQLPALCPHLNKGQIKELLRPRLPCLSFVTPPLAADGAYHVFMVRNPPRHSSAEVVHRRSGFGPLDMRVLYAEEAQAFAKEAWGDKLICLDSQQAFARITLLVPFRLPLTGAQRRRQVRSVSMALSCSCVRDNSCRRESKTRSQRLDDSILAFTDDGPASRELQGHLPVWDLYNCSGCGGGLDKPECSVCGSVEFHTSDQGFLVAGKAAISLPAKVVEFLKSRKHRFSTEPSSCA